MKSMISSIKSLIIYHYKNPSASLAYISVITSAIFWILNTYRNLAFAIACISGMDMLVILLLKIARSNVEDDEIKDQDWKVPLVYAMGFALMIIFYCVNWLFLGCYGPAGTKAKTAYNLDLINSVYFSITTSTTLGYGDLVPLTSGAKMLAAVQALTCSIYMTAGLAVLFTKHRKPIFQSND